MSSQLPILFQTTLNLLNLIQLLQDMTGVDYWVQYLVQQAAYTLVVASKALLQVLQWVIQSGQ